jgi:hypothetical protein
LTKSELPVHNLTQDELRELSVKGMNGREIKNVVKLAVALAEHEDESLSFKHLVRTMNTMRDCQTTGSVSTKFQPLSYLGSTVPSMYSVLTFWRSQ